MMSEACVTSYLDAQVLGAGWQVVLQMLPDERDYDLQMVKQVALEVFFSALYITCPLLIRLLHDTERRPRSNIFHPARQYL